MEIQDQSNDKQYFTIIPNYIANHSSANDQALYFQMKRYAEEKGKCFASEKLLMDKLKIGNKALKKSIKYLTEHEWISLIGKEKIETTGGKQERKVYVVNDIWEMNNNFYKGVVESEPLDDKGVVESNSRGVQKEAKGVCFQKTKKNNNNKNNKEDITKTFFQLKETPTDIKQFCKEKCFSNVEEELENFKGYWTETNSSGKERWQGEKYFDIKRRLNTWFKNKKIYDNENKKGDFRL